MCSTPRNQRAELRCDYEENWSTRRRGKSLGSLLREQKAKFKKHGWMNFPQFGIMSGGVASSKNISIRVIFRHFSLCCLHKACVTSILPWRWIFFIQKSNCLYISISLIIFRMIRVAKFTRSYYWQSRLGKSKFYSKLTSKYSVSHVSEFQ